MELSRTVPCFHSQQFLKFLELFVRLLFRCRYIVLDVKLTSAESRGNLCQNVSLWADTLEAANPDLRNVIGRACHVDQSHA